MRNGKVAIIGCGLYGSVIAHELANKNIKVHVFEKRNHVGGNCYTELKEGIHIHKYGPHIFHTNDKRIWDYINQFGSFNQKKLHTKVSYKGKIYSFPINLFTLNQIYGIKNPQEAILFFEKIKKEENQNSIEDWCISNIGKELYEIFVKGYTEKQWGACPSQLPSSIIKRIPVRTNYDDRYFNDSYEGIPENGYTRLFENMLDNSLIKINLSVDFFENKKEIEKDFDFVIYSGPIDQFYDYKFGKLDYRSLRFEEERFDCSFQGNQIINYTDSEIPYTRIVEHKYFVDSSIKHTWITREYPQKFSEYNEPFYPINTKENNFLYDKYNSIINEKFIFGGRLGRYKYYDMHQVVAASLNDSEKVLKKWK